MTSTQYLQVPKVLPHRKVRSRSRSRSNEAIAVNQFPSKDQPRLVSPPAPSLQQLAVRPSIKESQNITPQIYRYTPRVEKKQDIIVDKPNVVEVEIKAQEKVAEQKIEDLNGEMYTLDDDAASNPAKPEPTLRERIIGAWKLESYVAYPTSESTIQRPTYPMTKNVTGFIMYTPDGYMSANMLIPGQPSFKRSDVQEAQWSEAAKRCFAYCGPYYITNEGVGREEVLRHTFQVCNLPGWIGDVQVRTHRFEEDGQVLVLGSEEPTEIKVRIRILSVNIHAYDVQGDKRRPVLKWRRARDNASGSPPPPTPAIKISGPGDP
ncbi:hypothetical protein MRB53_037845 [Persea americana]|nr:hypothetical protein MRB53_037845 [Persea americana]